MQQLEQLQKLLPDFQKDLELFPTSMSLTFLLQDIYTDYIDYCIIIVRNLTRPPLGKIATRAGSFQSTQRVTK